MDDDIGAQINEAAEYHHLASPIALGTRVLPNFRARAQQKVISDAIVDAVTGRGPRFIAVSVPQQFGKALDVETPVATPEGWTTMGQLRVGDWVFGGDGKPIQVVAVTPPQIGRPCFAVKTDDKEVIVADAEHMWLARLDRHSHSKANLYPTRVIARKRWARAQLPIHGPLNLPEKDLPIPPYTLGLWLGDGTSTCGAITSSVEDQMELRSYVEGDGFTTRSHKNSTGSGWGVLGLHVLLRTNGLLQNKHIPEQYLRASQPQRLALLQGLVDSDGHADARGHIEFCTTREELVEDFLELVRSLGVKVNAHKRTAYLNGVEVGPKWSIVFYHGEGARLRRKRERLRWPKRSHRFVDAVEVPSVPVRCIQVGAEDGMFLAGKRMVPTHNSQITSVLTPALWIEWYSLGVVPGGLVGLMSYEDSLAMKWSVDVRRMIASNPDVFVSTLRKDAKAAGYWETEQGGGIIAIGTAGSIQGRPISLLGIDDPTKNFDQAMSPNHQMKLWDNWTSVLYGRLQPWTVVLVTMARWAPDDFIGRLTSEDYEGDPKDWRYIRIPYIAEGDGDPLGRKVGEPLIRPQADQSLDEAVAEAEKVKQNSSTYSWASLWQQNPSDDETAIFPESKWRYWGGDSDYFLPDPEQFDTVLMSWDMAFKDQTYHDFVVGQAWGAKGEDRYLIDQVRGHWGFTETCQRVSLFAQKIRSKYANARAVLIEDKANGPAVIDTLRSKVGGLIEVTPEESKLARAWACQPLQAGGNLYLPAQSQHVWVRDFIKELAIFRGESRGQDDQVDAMTQALKFLMFYRQAPITLGVANFDTSPAAIGFRARSLPWVRR